MDLQAILINIFYGIFKLAIVMIFVTAMIQVVKGVSAVGFFRIFWEIARTLLKSKDHLGRKYEVSEETWKTLNFVIALVGLRLLNFTLLAQFLSLDLEHLGRGAAWFDYLGTAALVYMGADWVFKNFVTLAEAGRKIKESLTTTSSASSSSTKETTTAGS